MTTTALVLAVLALALSAASLAWQTWTWFRSGPRLKVTTENALTDAVTPDSEWYVAVKVTNLGRAAATIESWGIEMQGTGGTMWKVQPLPFSTPLPTRLDPYSSATYYVEAEALRERHDSQGTAYSTMRPFVGTAGGRRIYSKGGVLLS